MLGLNGREVARVIFTPPAKGLVRLGVTANWVTAIGTAATCAVALTLFPLGHLWLGAVILGALVTTDALDGTMARLAGSSSRWGAFLDSTLDRVADGAIFGGLTIYLITQHDTWGAAAGVAALALGAIVPYARSKAEGLGFTASVGIAERSDRLAVALLAAFVTGVGAPRWVLTLGLTLLALASAITVGQRAFTVHRQSTQATSQGPGT